MAAAAPPLSPTPMMASGAEHHANPKPIVPGAPIRVTSPQPLRALERRASMGATRPRDRSPSGTTFADLAQHGKKQLNQLRGFLEKSGTVKDGSGGRESQALKTVRAKREADEAGKLTKPRGAISANHANRQGVPEWCSLARNPSPATYQDSGERLQSKFEN